MVMNLTSDEMDMQKSDFSDLFLVSLILMLTFESQKLPQFIKVICLVLLESKTAKNHSCVLVLF